MVEIQNAGGSLNDQIRTIFFALFLSGTFGFNAAASSPKRPLSVKSIEKTLSKDSLNVSKSEYRLGHNLAKLYEVAEKGYFNKRLAKKRCIILSIKL